MVLATVATHVHANKHVKINSSCVDTGFLLCFCRSAIYHSTPRATFCAPINGKECLGKGKKLENPQ